MQRRVVIITIIVLLLIGLSYFLYINYQQGQNAKLQIQQAEKENKNASGNKETARNTNNEIFIGKQAVIKLTALNNSSQSGTAIIKDYKDHITVDLQVLSDPQNPSQPAHIHSGSCPKPGPVQYPLKPVINGKSITNIQIPFNQFIKDLPLAINVHKSDIEMRTYVSCGNITTN